MILEFVMVVMDLELHERCRMDGSGGRAKGKGSVEATLEVRRRDRGKTDIFFVSVLMLFVQVVCSPQVERVKDNIAGIYIRSFCVKQGAFQA